MLFAVCRYFVCRPIELFIHCEPEKGGSKFCDHNSGKYWSILIFLHCCKQEEMFYTCMTKISTSPNNVLMLPSENENSTSHTFIMHSLNITRCIKLNDRPDGIIHKIEVWWVPWPHVWHYGLAFSNVCMRPEFMTSISCDSIYCMCGDA